LRPVQTRGCAQARGHGGIPVPVCVPESMPSQRGALNHCFVWYDAPLVWPVLVALHPACACSSSSSAGCCFRIGLSKSGEWVRQDPAPLGDLQALSIWPAMISKGRRSPLFDPSRAVCASVFLASLPVSSKVGSGSSLVLSGAWPSGPRATQQERLAVSGHRTVGRQDRTRAASEFACSLMLGEKKSHSRHRSREAPPSGEAD
jgi:hypothetical protein